MPWLTEYILDLKTGTATETHLDEGAEFPVVSPFRATLPTRYIYAGRMGHRGGCP